LKLNISALIGFGMSYYYSKANSNTCKYEVFMVMKNQVKVFWVVTLDLKMETAYH